MSDTIKDAYDKLVTEKEELLKSIEPLEKIKADKLSAYQVAEKEYKDICTQIKEKTQPRLYDVSVEIAALARMLPNHVKPPVT